MHDGQTLFYNGPRQRKIIIVVIDTIIQKSKLNEDTLMADPKLLLQKSVYHSIPTVFNNQNKVNYLSRLL